MDDEYVSTEHLVVGLATGDSDVAKLLTGHGASPQALREAFVKVRGSARVTSPDPEGSYQALEKYSTDLTERAREGKLDPVIGRDNEIRRVVQVLEPSHQEQPGADRRARRRQDRDRRGPGPAHRGRRRAGEPARQDRRLA